MIGRVVSAKMVKSAVVIIESQKKHPLYGKKYLRTKKYIVDDPMGVKEGDVVVIEKIRPISKNKHFQIKKVLGRDIISMETAQLQASAEEAISEVLPEEKEKEEVVENAQPAAEEVAVVEKKVKEEKISKKVAKKETK